jgi:hypothetical protein
MGADAIISEGRLCVLILLYLVVCVLIYTTIYASSRCYIWGTPMCPHTTILVLILLYGFSYYCLCPHMYCSVHLLWHYYMCPHTAIWFLILLFVSSYVLLYMRPHAAISEGRCFHIWGTPMCPHTTIFSSMCPHIYCYICVLTLLFLRAAAFISEGLLCVLILLI